MLLCSLLLPTPVVEAISHPVIRVQPRPQLIPPEARGPVAWRHHVSRVLLQIHSAFGLRRPWEELELEILPPQNQIVNILMPVMCFFRFSLMRVMPSTSYIYKVWRF